MKTITDGSAVFAVRDKRMQAMIDMLYPVGTVYATTESVKPEFMNYGTWEQVAQGRTLIGAGTGTDNNNLSMTFKAGDSGGEYNHRLSTDEIPMMYIQSDGFGGLFGQSINGGASIRNEGFAPSNGMSYGDRANTLHVGGNDTPHNNIQPYLVVYIFKRVA